LFDWETALVVPGRSGSDGRPRFRAIGCLRNDLLTVVFSPLGTEAVSIMSLRRASRGKGSCMSRRKRKVSRLSAADEAHVQAGIASDPDNPEWTAQDFRRAEPFAKSLPGLAKSRRTRGPQKQPTKVAVSLRLTREMVERFKADGAGWQTRMDEALKKAVGL
jgi:uncharacterized protein (DUF4415 family)